jgi:hypothetical protein
MSDNLFIKPVAADFNVDRICAWLDARPDAVAVSPVVYRIGDSPVHADLLYRKAREDRPSSGTFVRIDSREILIEREGGTSSLRTTMELLKWLQGECELRVGTGWSGEVDVTDEVRANGVEHLYENEVRNAELLWPKQLREIGFFRDLSYGHGRSVSLEQARREGPGTDDDAVITYLSSGHVFRAEDTMATNDVGHVIGPLLLLTDGVYIWPSLLAEQVRRAHVRLPRHFLIHARSNGWRIPDVDLAALHGSENIPPLTANEVAWYTRPIISPSVEGDACPLFVGRRVAIVGKRLRSGSADAVHRGYTEAGARVLVTFTMRHDDSYDELTERLRFEHERIAPLLYIGRTEGGRGYIDELVEREPDGRSLQERGLLPEAAAIRLGIAAAEVLNAFHDQGVVLGGLAPEVIYVDDSNCFTQLTPRSRRFVASVNLQSGGPRSYTLPYSGYEALVLGRGSDEQGDIFALCASLFQAVTGKHPFGASLPEILQRIMTKQPLPYPGSREFGALLMRGLDAEPNKRPEAQELASALASLSL